MVTTIQKAKSELALLRKNWLTMPNKECLAWLNEDGSVAYSHMTYPNSTVFQSEMEKHGYTKTILCGFGTETTRHYAKTSLYKKATVEWGGSA